MPVNDLTAVLLQGLGDAATQPLGLAVSGGGDSMALLHLAHRAGLAVQVATVDHGLRAESAAEADLVARVCAGLGVPHQVLRWRGWDGRGNLQDQARRARRRLLADWAGAAGLPAVALAHSEDDLAETLLMRLARGAGVDGLAAMAARQEGVEVTWLRPLLAVSRQALRGYLTGIGAEWVDDPSNAADRFDRVRARKALAALAPLGLRRAVLAGVAHHLAEAREALEAAADAAAARHLHETDGMVWIAASLWDEPGEIRRRLLQRVLLWIAPADYAPRGAALQGLLARLASGKSAQLAGCHFLVQQDRVLAFREARAVQDLRCPQTGLWDNRWRFAGPMVAAAEIRALGAAGLAQIAGWREFGVPRAALLSHPALWQGDAVIAAAGAGDLLPQGELWQANCDPAPFRLFHSVLSH